MAHYEPPHQDLRCLQIKLFSSLVVKELSMGLISEYQKSTKLLDCFIKYQNIDLN